MNKALKILVSSFIFVMIAGSAFAADGVKEGASAWAVFLGAGFAIGIAALGCGIGMGRAIDSALQGVSRNPGAQPKIMTMMILGLALIESLAIYALVVSILLLFVI